MHLDYYSEKTLKIFSDPIDTKKENVVDMVNV